MKLSEQDEKDLARVDGQPVSEGRPTAAENKPIPPLADRYFDALIRQLCMECELDDALLVAVGAIPDVVDTWPCGDLVYDDYDSSFELRGTTPGWEPTPAQLAAAWALGFARGWVCYTDSTERYYAPGYETCRPLKASAHCGPSDGTRRKRQLRKRIAQLEASLQALSPAAGEAQAVASDALVSDAQPLIPVSK